MTARARLPNRRRSQTFGFEVNGLRYTATVSFFPNGDLAEIFLGNAKAGSHSDSAAKDSAVVCSIALQHGVPLEMIQRALLRDPHGVASSPLGVALDLVAEMGAGSGPTTNLFQLELTGATPMRDRAAVFATTVCRIVSDTLAEPGDASTRAAALRERVAEVAREEFSDIQRMTRDDIREREQ